MPPRFIKVAEPDALSRDIVLNVRGSDDGRIFGRIIAMKVTHAGPTPMTTADDDPEIAEAIRLAASAATTAGVDVSVVDPGGLWQDGWGPLETPDR